MTAEEKLDLQIAIELIRDLTKKVDAIPQHTQEAIESQLQLHLARFHTNDEEVVREVRALWTKRVESGAIKAWCCHYWKVIVVALAAVAAALEILERTHVI